MSRATPRSDARRARRVVLYDPDGPRALRFEDAPVPEPSPTQVLVRVRACGVCGHDQADWSGLTSVRLPAVLGHEIAGTVVAVGAAVRDFAFGDHVAAKQFATCGRCVRCRSGDELACSQRAFNYGGFAEFALVERTALRTVPDGVSFAAAAVTACAVGTPLQALRDVARVRPGERVAVTGAGGGLGLHGLQVANLLGAYTVGVTGSPDKAAELAGHCDVTITSTGSPFWSDILDATSGHGVDVVLDTAGVPALFASCFRALARRGRYVFAGQVTRAKVELYPAFVFGKEAVITGSQSTSTATFATALELVHQGRITPVVRSFDLDDAPAVGELVDQRAILGRAVLVPSP